MCGVQWPTTPEYSDCPVGIDYRIRGLTFWLYTTRPLLCDPRPPPPLPHITSSPPVLPPYRVKFSATLVAQHHTAPPPPSPLSDKQVSGLYGSSSTVLIRRVFRQLGHMPSRPRLVFGTHIIVDPCHALTLFISRPYFSRSSFSFFSLFHLASVLLL